MKTTFTHIACIAFATLLLSGCMPSQKRIDQQIDSMLVKNDNPLVASYDPSRSPALQFEFDSAMFAHIYDSMYATGTYSSTLDSLTLSDEEPLKRWNGATLHVRYSADDGWGCVMLKLYKRVDTHLGTTRYYLLNDYDYLHEESTEATESDEPAYYVATASDDPDTMVANIEEELDPDLSETFEYRLDVIKTAIKMASKH